MSEALSGQHETPPEWPLSLDVPRVGRVWLVQPGARYPAGSTLAVIWPYTSPPVDPSVLRARAERFGKPWQPSTAIPAIGVQLAAPRMGWEVINGLTAGAWKVTDPSVIPFEVPPHMIADGLTMADFAAAGKALTDTATGFAGAMQGAVSSGGSALTAGAWILAAAPWILMTAGLVLGGLWIYRKAK